MNQAIISRDFNPSWKSLGDDTSLKGAVIHSLSVMYGYGCSHEQFVHAFHGKGKVTVDNDHIIVDFGDLSLLGIDVDSTRCTADLDCMMREKIIAGMSGAVTEVDKMAARSKIIGTIVNGINTTPAPHTNNHQHPQHHRP